jgi:hypothetical protein
VQLVKVKSAGMVAAKFKAMMEDMKVFAETAVKKHGIKGVTAGTLTPAKRFEDDKDVPDPTRYSIPKGIVEATYGASQEETNRMDDWDKEMKRINEVLKKEKDKNADAASAGTSKSDADFPDIIGSQQSQVSVAVLEDVLNNDMQ